MTTPPVGANPPDPIPPEKSQSAGDIDKNAFLKLLVAQLKNQNPLNPADGTAFVTQLAGFSQLEQAIAMRQDLAAIRAALESSARTEGESAPDAVQEP